MEIDWNKALAFLFSMIAIGISVVTIVMTRKNLRKQLRLSKLEEILEIIHYLNGYYTSMFRIFVGFEEGIQDLKKSDEISSKLVETIKYRKKFVEVVNKETIVNKISRVKVLSNAYLANSRKVNSLKNRIHTITDVYYNMYMFIYMEGNSSVIIKEDDAIIPTPNGMEKFINKIENDIIIEMNLGYKNIDSKSKIKYFKTQFKKELES